MRKRVILRADSSTLIGFGHLYRMLALTELLVPHFEVLLITNCHSDFILKQFNKFNVIMHIVSQVETSDMDILGWKQPSETNLKEILNVVNVEDILVIDGYQFDLKFQKALNKVGCKQVYIDDLILDYPFADAIINHAPGLSSQMYKSNCNLYLGLEYAMVRDTFFSPQRNIDKDEQVFQAFVCFGGSSIVNEQVAKILKTIIESQKFSKVNFVCAENSLSFFKSEMELVECSNTGIKYFVNLNSDEVRQMMDSCTHAFVSASTILMESFFRGLHCFAGLYTENQEHFYNGFTSYPGVEGIGDIRDFKDMLLKSKLNDLSPAPKYFQRVARNPENLLNVFKDLSICN